MPRVCMYIHTRVCVYILCTCVYMRERSSAVSPRRRNLHPCQEQKMLSVPAFTADPSDTAEAVTAAEEREVLLGPGLGLGEMPR